MVSSGQPYALAGLWEKWKDRKAGAELLTFTVITTDPNEVVEPLHNRMPVIIPERDYDRWLKPDPERPPIDLLRPFDAKKMIAWKVGKAVGNVKNDRNRLPYECYRGHLSLGRRIHTIRRCGSSNRILPGVVRRPSLLLGVRITVMRLSAPPKRS